MYKYSEYQAGNWHKFEHKEKQSLLLIIQSHYKKHNLIFSGEMISAAIDRQSPLKTAAQKPNLQAVVRGASALLKTLSGISVSNQEITRRSNICASCPLIDSIGGCNSCGAAGKITQWANSLRAKRKLQIEIPDSIKRQYCGFCQCALALMVITPHKEFENEREEKNQTRPDNCWLKRTSANFTHE